MWQLRIHTECPELEQSDEKCVNLRFGTENGNLMTKKRKIITVFAAVAAGVAAVGCGFDKYPPKTDDAAKEYVKPKGSIPTQEEKDIVNAARAEYEQAVKAAE